jgi:hypothetical protein
MIVVKFKICVKFDKELKKEKNGPEKNKEFSEPKMQ